MRSSLRAALLALVLLLPSQALRAEEFKAGAIEIDHPWSRATPGGASVGAGYLALRNKGDVPDRLVSASVEIAGRTEIHEMRMSDDVTQMRQREDGVVIPAGGEVALKPGASHLMFLDLSRPLKEGESFTGTLNFEHAGSATVVFKVEKTGAAAPSASGHQGH